jgi:hypothetical protein
MSPSRVFGSQNCEKYLFAHPGIVRSAGAL